MLLGADPSCVGLAEFLMLLPLQIWSYKTWTEQFITLIQQLKHAVLKSFLTVQLYQHFIIFCLMHFSVDMKWQKFCFFSIIYPWFLFFGSHLRLPGLQMWSGEDVIDQYLILSCMVSKPVTTSIRVAVGNHGYMCVWYTDYQIMHNLQFDLVIHDISILDWFCKLRLIRPVCLCPCIPRCCSGHLLPLLCMT